MDKIEEDKRIEYLQGHEDGVLAGLSLSRMLLKSVPSAHSLFATMSDYQQNKKTLTNAEALILEQYYDLYK